MTRREPIVRTILGWPARCWRRWSRGEHWSWRDQEHGPALPADFETRVMSLNSSDRFHAKQGRSTARVRFDSGLSIYLKRHQRLPWRTRLLAWLSPGRCQTPAGEEWRHLEIARSLGIPVPDTVAAGEWIGPKGQLSGYLAVAELVGHEALNEAVPALAETLAPETFERWKRHLIPRLAVLTARLHGARMFHQDLYLCHYFLDTARDDFSRVPRIVLIDLHRLTSARWLPSRPQVKDLAQLLFSTDGVAGVNARDIQRFWMHYKRAHRLGRGHAGFLRRWTISKAKRYRAHNQRTAARIQATMRS